MLSASVPLSHPPLMLPAESVKTAQAGRGRVLGHPCAGQPARRPTANTLECGIVSGAWRPVNFAGETPCGRDRAQSVQIHLRNYRPLGRSSEAGFPWTDIGSAQGIVSPCRASRGDGQSSDKFYRHLRLNGHPRGRIEAILHRSAAFCLARPRNHRRSEKRFLGGRGTHENPATTSSDRWKQVGYERHNDAQVLHAQGSGPAARCDTGAGREPVENRRPPRVPRWVAQVGENNRCRRRRRSQGPTRRTSRSDADTVRRHWPSPPLHGRGPPDSRSRRRPSDPFACWTKRPGLRGRNLLEGTAIAPR